MVTILKEQTEIFEIKQTEIGLDKIKENELLK
jgi:hypothetical protein